MTMTEATLRVSGVTKFYGGVQALAGVDLELHAREVVGLIGQNGAGKTTLVDVICGATEPTDGRVDLGGRAVKGGASSRARHGFARTFQYPQVAAGLSVRDNLLLGYWGVRCGGPARIVDSVWRGIVFGRTSTGLAEVADVAARCGLHELDQPAGDLLLSEQRLLEVARALLSDPTVLLLDEPFAGADGASVNVILGAIRTARDAGCAVLLVDHNVDLVARASDRVALMHQGKIAVHGTPDECLASDVVRQVYLGQGVDG